ncbi:MAG TPA: ABC transporter ATP-binding protein [Desulfatirhabdiaceae bacterium]|nr:ABC transporter ATP-binding protein [Desulfatirhabdiaceae bacterium]
MALSLMLSGITKAFSINSGPEYLTVFDGIDFSVAKGQFFSIVGPSGCGKSTLLKIIAGLDHASEGSIILEGEPILERDPRIGLIFQEFALFPWRTAIENIEMGLELQGMSKPMRRIEAMQFISAFGLMGFENHYPHELSGGMKQRVAIARTLITNPEVVLMDEPFGALDSQTRNLLQEFLLNVWKERQDTVLFVTHNVDEAVYLSDRIAVLSPRPSKILQIFDIDLPRPRDRTCLQVNHFRRAIFDLLNT